MSSPSRLTRAGTALLLTGMALATAGCSQRNGTISGYPEAARLSELRSMSDEEWESGHVLESILLLEHACARVVIRQIRDEGGHDYMIKTRVRELFERGDRASLQAMLRDSAYFPQASGWIVAWATESDTRYGLPASAPSERIEITRKASAFDRRLAKELSRRPGR